MDSEEKYEKAILDLYFNQKKKMTESDFRREELKAMTDAFLGENYDQSKLQLIDKIQTEVAAQQRFFLNQLTKGLISSERYVDELNLFYNETFKKCEKILGKRDFEKLFGCPLEEEAIFVDKNQFIEFNKPVEANDNSLFPYNQTSDDSPGWERTDDAEDIKNKKNK